MLHPKYNVPYLITSNSLQVVKRAAAGGPVVNGIHKFEDRYTYARIHYSGGHSDVRGEEGRSERRKSKGGRGRKGAK